MGAARSEAVALIKSWIGKKESNGSHKSIVDIYNTQKSLPRNFKMTYTAAWCATTVTAVFVKLGAVDIIAPECSCGFMIADAKKMGIWKESDSYVPKAGDIIMYDWGDSGKGDCTGWPEHVGMVTEVSGKVFKVVEGNKSNAVGTRTMSVNGKYIRGYIVPKYSGASSVSKPSGASDDKNTKLTIDGKWGTYTTKKTQEVLGTTEDGLVSNQLASCKDYLPNANSGSWEFQSKKAGYSDMILAMQKKFGMSGNDLDGLAGEDTVRAMQKFLNKETGAGLKIDGCMGTLTVKAWQTWLNKQ